MPPQPLLPGGDPWAPERRLEGSAPSVRSGGARVPLAACTWGLCAAGQSPAAGAWCPGLEWPGWAAVCRPWVDSRRDLVVDRVEGVGKVGSVRAGGGSGEYPAVLSCAWPWSSSSAGLWPRSLCVPCAPPALGSPLRSCASRAPQRSRFSTPSVEPRDLIAHANRRLPGRWAGRGDFFTLSGSLVVVPKVCSSSCLVSFSEDI